MASIVFQTNWRAGLMAMTEHAPGGEAGREPERFPTWRFKRLIALGGFYRANGRFGENSSSSEAEGDETCFGVPWAAIERADLADVVTVVSRVLEDARRHNFTAKHFAVWCAMEAGIIIERTPRGMNWRYAFPEKPKKVMDDYETARMFVVSERTARDYRDDVQTALNGEWFWLKTRER
jgi:hypothetical protein